MAPISREQAIELNRLAATASAPSGGGGGLAQLVLAAADTASRKLSLAFACAMFGSFVALLVELRFGGSDNDEGFDGAAWHDDRDWRKPLALALSLSCGAFVILTSRATTTSTTSQQQQQQEHEPVTTSSSLTPKQLRLLGRTGQELVSNSKQVEKILSAATPSSNRPARDADAAPSITPAPPLPLSFATPSRQQQQPSVASLFFSSSSSTPVRPASSTSSSSATPTTTGSASRLVAQDDARFSSPQSPRVLQTPKSAALTPAVASPKPPPLPSSSSSAAAAAASSSSSSVADETAAFALVEELELDMDRCVDRLKTALLAHIKKDVLDKLDAVHAKLASAKPAAASEPWYPKEVLEWQQLRDVQEMHAYQEHLLSQEDRLELKRLFAQRNALAKYFEVRRHAGEPLASRHHVLNRLRDLVKTDMRTFAWSAPATTAPHPSDAEILFRVACVWLDSCLQSEVLLAETGGGGRSGGMLDQDASFSSKHVWPEISGSGGALVLDRDAWGFVDCGRYHHAATASSSSLGGGLFEGAAANTPSLLPAQSPASSSSVSLQHQQHQQAYFHPHWKVVVSGRVWEVTHGSGNLFHALTLFLYSLRANSVMGRVQQDMIMPVLGK